MLIFLVQCGLLQTAKYQQTAIVNFS